MRFENSLLPKLFLRTGDEWICSLMNIAAASATPKPEAAIRLTVLATSTTTTMTRKSRTVSRLRTICSDFQSIILTPMTISSAASAGTGTQAISGVSTSTASSAHKPWNTPDR